MVYGFLASATASWLLVAAMAKLQDRFYLGLAVGWTGAAVSVIIQLGWPS